MERKYESLADSSDEKTEAKRPTISQISKPPCSARYHIPFIILLYFLAVLGLILHYHNVFAGKEYCSVSGMIARDNIP